MAATAVIGPMFYGWDRNGKPLAYGKLYTYQSGTDTPKVTYDSEDEATENTNPIILNGEGYASVYLAGSYKFVLKDSDDNEIWSVDLVTGAEQSIDPWVSEQAITYASPNSFKITGNFTDVFIKDRAVKISDATEIYGHITGSIYLGGETIVIIESTDALSVSANKAWVGSTTKESAPNTGEFVAYVNNISELQGLDISKFKEGDQVNVAFYHNMTDSSGGGVVVFTTGIHNAGTFFGHGVGFPDDWNDQAQLTAWLAVGGSDVAGFERVNVDYVTPEMFGAGVSQLDNDFFTSAASTEKPIKAFGSEYNLDQLIFRSSVDLEFSKNTIINNKQASGAKKTTIRCIGTGRVGTVMTVTELGSGLYSEITVNDATQLSVGDTVEMRENTALRLETNVSSPSMQDFNYYEFLTVESIAGNVITFEEFVGGEFELGNGVLLSKVQFLEECNVRGGIHRGDGYGGGGVEFLWCRKSSADVVAIGNGEDIDLNERFGGAAGLLTDCWECDLVVSMAQWTLFSAFVTRIQSCHVEVKGGKRTSNGGLIVESARSSYLIPSTQDNPGDQAGDGMGVSGRTWGCTFGPMTIAGSRCHTVWVRQPVKNNTFGTITSINSITSILNLYGDDNFFTCVKALGSPGVTFEGNRNNVHVEYEGANTGVFFAAGTTGNKLTGRSVCTAASGAWDVLIGGDITNTTIDLDCGVRGLNYGGGVSENHTNNINVRGPNPYGLGVTRTPRGFIWSTLMSGVTDTPKSVLIPGGVGDTNGLKQFLAPSNDIPFIYKIKVKAANFIADTYSEYILTGGQSTWDIVTVKQGLNSFAPAIQDSSGVIVIKTNASVGNVNMALSIERF